MKQVYDAINENPDCPNISIPDETEDKAIVEFHACKSFKMPLYTPNNTVLYLQDTSVDTNITISLQLLLLCWKVLEHTKLLSFDMEKWTTPSKSGSQRVCCAAW